jgi:hypothetical protein
MEMLELGSFTSGWKIFWCPPDELKCYICDQLASFGFGVNVPTQPTRCEICVKKLASRLSEENDLMINLALDSLK